MGSRRRSSGRVAQVERFRLALLFASTGTYTGKPMKLLLQRLSQMLREIVRALGAYRDLVLAWLNGVAAHLFPTPVKVRATSPRATKPHR